MDNENKELTYICNRPFKSLGIEAGDYFPAHRFTKVSVEKFVKDGTISYELLNNPPNGKANKTKV